MEEVKISGIYKITSPTGRIYIGQAEIITKRWKEYKYMNSKVERQTKLWRSFKKHGVENHIFEVLEDCPLEDLNCRERYWQDFYDVLNGGLNCTLQECGEQRRVFSEEVREKIGRKGESNPMYGKKWSEETRERIKTTKIITRGVDNPLYGKPKSEEHKKKISNTRKEKGLSKKENNPNWGKPRSEEDKNSISEARKGINTYGGTHTAKKVVDVTTGIVYSCIKEVSDLFNLDYNKLRNALTGRIKNKTVFKLHIDNEL